MSVTARRSVVFSKGTLSSTVALPPELRLFTGQLKYVSSADLQSRPLTADVIEIFVPFASLAARLPLCPLLGLAARHNVSIPRLTRTVTSVYALLQSHMCDEQCECISSLFKVCHLQSPLLSLRFVPHVPSNDLIHLVEACVNQSSAKVPFSSLSSFPVVHGSCAPPSAGDCEFVGHMRVPDVERIMRDVDTYAFNIALHALMPLLNYRNIVKLADTHRIFIPTSMRTHRTIASLLINHDCSSSCGHRFSVFKVIRASEHIPFN